MSDIQGSSKKRVAALRHLHDKLKSGDYDGTDVMAAWIAVEDLACLLERAENEPEARLVDLNIRAHEGEPMQVDAAFQGEAVKAFASVFVDWFKQSGGENFVTCSLRDPDAGDEYVITMQKSAGKTPAQTLSELRAEIATLRAAQPPFLKRRPYLEESDAWTSAEDERDWWRNYALQIEASCSGITKESAR